MDSCLWSFLEFYTWLNRIKLYFLWGFVKVEFVESGLELVKTGLTQHAPVAFFPVAAQGTSLKRVKTCKIEAQLPGKKPVADLTQCRTCEEPRWIRIIRGGSRSKTQLYYFCKELHLFSDFSKILLVTKVPRVSVEGKTKKSDLQTCFFEIKVLFHDFNSRNKRKRTLICEYILKSETRTSRARLQLMWNIGPEISLENELKHDNLTWR